MIEADVVSLVQGNSAVRAVCTKGGGFFGTLPKDEALPSWTYITVWDGTSYTLQGPETASARRVQIDCYGSTAADAINLANAIYAVLNGYRGKPANGTTNIQGCFHINSMDYFDPDSRTFRRMLEFNVWFNTLTN